jgi:ubiquinone biosynthesis accessory factor UbiK
MKLPNDLLNDITNQVGDLFGQSQQVGNDIKENMKALLQSQLSKLDLVSREEFDNQAAVLLKTREKLDALEKLMADMEHKLNNDTL